MPNSANQIIIRHLGKPRISALGKRGIAVMSTTVIPGAGPMPFANGQTGYNVNDNGTGRVLTLAELLKL